MTASKKKILILRFSSIGDIVLTTPVTRCIKEQLGAEVHFCTKASFRGMLETNPYVDKVHVLEEKQDAKLITQLKAEKFDFIVDLHRNLRTVRIKKALNVPAKAFPKLNFKKYLLIHFKIRKMPKIHIVDRYFEAAQSLVIQNDQKGLDYFIPEKDQLTMQDFPELHRQNGFYAFAIGGQHATKKLPLERMIELCEKINQPIVLLGGPEDRKVATKIESHFLGQNSKSIYNSVGTFNLNQSASATQLSKGLFTHDTGMMHIGAALKKPIVSIWGNTVPELGMYPYLTEHQILENKDLSCRPCSKLGYDQCPKGHFKCMQELELDFMLPL